MKNLILIALMLTSLTAIAGLEDFKVIGGNAEATFTTAQVTKMLMQGNTCLKDGGSVKYHSKNVTKKQCRKSTKLGLRVIKVKNLEIDLYNQVMGFKAIKKQGIKVYDLTK